MDSNTFIHPNQIIFTQGIYVDPFEKPLLNYYKIIGQYINHFGMERLDCWLKAIRFKYSSLKNEDFSFSRSTGFFK